MKKMRKNAGFTLVEMLIVVAIIAILVAVSIPLVSSSLEKARIATDNANERAAKAEGTIEYLNETRGEGDYAYDAASGQLLDEGEEPDQPYGKCTTNSHEDDYIIVTISDDFGSAAAGSTNPVTIEWANGGPNHNGMGLPTATPETT